MLAILKSLFGGTVARIVFSGIILSSIAAGGYAVYRSIWASGYDQAVSEYESARLREIEAAVEKARQEWEISAEIAKSVLDRERFISEVVHELNNQVPEAVADSGCDHVGERVLELYNSAIRGAPAESPAGPTP